jgi:hypothetical protein
VLLHPVGLVGHVVHSGASWAQNINTLFFMLLWACLGFHIKHTGTRYPKLVFLYPVVSVGHVLLFGAFEPLNEIALFFMLGWDRYGFDK